MTDTGSKLISAASEAAAIASGKKPAGRIWIDGFAYIPDPGFDVEFVVEALSMIEDGEGDADDIARQTLIAIGRAPSPPE